MEKFAKVSLKFCQIVNNGKICQIWSPWLGWIASAQVSTLPCKHFDWGGGELSVDKLSGISFPNTIYFYIWICTCKKVDKLERESDDDWNKKAKVDSP